MTEKGRKMLINHRPEDQRDLPAGLSARLNAERDAMARAARLQAIKDAGAIPDVCGGDIAPAPARGGFVLVRNVEMLPVGTGRVEAVHRGYGGRAAIRRADPFDAMLAAAARRGQPAPLTPGQIAIGRRYHDLVELLTADGMKLSSLQGSAGRGDARDWMDRRLAFSGEVEAMRQRIGTGVAKSLRRVRPSKRGTSAARAITDRELVDAVCLRGLSVKRALVSIGWQGNGRNCGAAIADLSAALDRMIGYGPKKRS